jgi:hypothetical protein
MTTPDAELRPLDYEAVAASYKERRPAQAAAPKGQFGVLPDLLLIAAWLVAAAAVVAGLALYAERETQIGLAISYVAGGVITALLVAAVGRIIHLLEVIAARGS